MEAHLARAIVAGNIKRIRGLLQTGRLEVTAKGLGGDTLLMHALGSEQWMPQVIDALLEAGVDINERNGSGATALYRAMECGWQAEQVRFLTSRGADPNIPDENGWTPLMIAIVSDWATDLDTLEALLEAGANVTREAKDGTTALSLAEEAAALGERAILAVLKKAR